MEFRKIIAFGKSSFVVSLPKDWLREFNLEKGDTVFIDREGEHLKVSPEQKNPHKEEKRIVLLVDGKDLLQVRREISAAFVQNNDIISVEGKTLAKISQEVIKIIHNLIALEIIDQSNTKIVARDFLKVSDVNVKDYLRKIDNIIRSMISDLTDSSFVDYTELADRQNHVRRIYLLLLKVFKALSKDSSLGHQMELDESGILSQYRLLVSQMRIAHCLRKISGALDVASSEDKVLLAKLMLRYQEVYNQVMKTFYTHNVDAAFKLGKWRDEEVLTLQTELPKTEHMLIIRERFIWMYYELHEVIHSTYN